VYWLHEATKAAITTRAITFFIEVALVSTKIKLFVIKTNPEVI
jgi:hypothetical protein